MLPKLLIADDEPGIVDIMKSYFTARGYDVLTAGDGNEALTKCASSPDLILLDINMLHRPPGYLYFPAGAICGSHEQHSPSGRAAGAHKK